jgi:hypothetical protein
MSIFANAYGNFLASALPFYQAMPGIVTPYGTLLKPGGRVAAYVRSTGAQDGEDHFASSGMLVSTLQAGLARCRSGQGDIVYVLPGHTESITSADFFTNLVAGTQIIGTGRPGASNNPTLTWNTSTSATFLLDVADVALVGLNLVMGGADNVTAPITVTGTGCSVVGCDVNMGTSSTLECAKAIIVSTGANNTLIAGNKFYNSGGAVCTAVIDIAAAVNRTTIANNDIDIEASGATDGAILISAVASTQGRIARNIIRNRRASAAVCIRIVDAASDGIISENMLATDADITVVGGTISASATASHKWRALQNFGHDENVGTALVGGLGTGTIE